MMADSTHASEFVLDDVWSMATYQKVKRTKMDTGRRLRKKSSRKLNIKKSDTKSTTAEQTEQAKQSLIKSSQFKNNSQKKFNFSRSERSKNNNKIKNKSLESENTSSTKAQKKSLMKERKELKEHVSKSNCGVTIRKAWLKQCTKCGRFLKSKVSFDRHMAVHVGVPLYMCDTCGKGFYTAAGLARHGLHHEKGSKNSFVCPTCNKGFIDEYSWRIHVEKHKLYEYYCKKCGKLFMKEQTLLSHTWENLCGNDVYLCLFCNKQYHSIESIKNHQEIIHGRKEEDVSFKMIDPDGSKMSITCSFCEMEVGNLTQYRCHARSHIPLPTSACPDCGKVFSNKKNMKRHQLTHSNIKPFLCHVCTQSFTQSPSLKAHLRCHTGELPWQCSICHKGFKQKTNLNTHCKKLHNIDTRNKVQPVLPARPAVLKDAKTPKEPYVHKKCQCPECGKWLSKHCALVKHILAHSIRKEKLKGKLTDDSDLQ